MLFSKNIISISNSFRLVATSFPISPGYRSKACTTQECKSMINAISGGNTGLLLLEIIVFVFIVLYLAVKIHERWFK